MNKNKELIKNTVILLLGKLCTQFVSFLLLPLYTAVLLSNEFGIVDLVTTYVGLIVPVITIQLETSLFRFLIDARNNENEKKRIISNVFIVATVLLVFCLILYSITCLFLNFEYELYLALIIISAVFVGLCLQVSRGLGDNISYSIASVISAVFTIGLNIILLVVFELGPIGMFISLILSNLASLSFLFFKEKIYKYLDLKVISKKKIKELVKYSLPLVPNGIIWWIISVSDRTIISIFLGTAANGIYAVANKFSSVFVNIYNIFNLSWTESVSLHVNDKDSFLANTVNNSLKLFSSMCLGLIAFMPYIFPIMINRQYASAYNYIPLLLIGTLLNIFVSMLGSIYIAKKLTKEIAKTSLYAGILNIIFNLLFIKSIGIYAAAVSTILSFLIMAIYRYYDVQKYVNIKISLKLLLSTIIMFVISIYLYYCDNWFLNIINVLIIVVYSITLNKQFLLATYNVLKNKILKKKVINEQK